MNIIEKAKKDWLRFSQSFSVQLIFTDPTSGETATITGIGTNNFIDVVDTDGQDAIGNSVHIGFNESLITEDNPLFPIRDTDNKVAMHNVLVSFLDSNGVLRNYAIKQTYADSTVGMIIADCSDYKTHPEAPQDVVFSNVAATSFTASITSNSTVQTGYTWEISEDDENWTEEGVSTDPTFDFTGKTTATTYYIRAKANGDIDSKFSNSESVTTL